MSGVNSGTSVEAPDILSDLLLVCGVFFPVLT